MIRNATVLAKASAIIAPVSGERRASAVRRLLTGLSLTTLLLTTGTLNAQSLEDRFNQPPQEAKPRARWWWPGAAVSQEELAREVELLGENGFAGAEVQSFATTFAKITPEERARINDYAEPRFFSDVAATARVARARGMDLDYTLGSAWPSGGGFAVTPEKALVELTMAVTSVPEGTRQPIRPTIPSRTKRLGALSFLDPRVKDPQVADWPARMDARARIVAVVAMRGTPPALKPKPTGGLQMSPWSDVTAPGTLDAASRIVLTDKLRADGTLEWTPPPGDWQILVFKQYAVNSGVLGAAGLGPQLVIDHMDPEAFATHVGRVADPLGSRPVGIRSTFVDSLELMQDLPWTERFLAEFQTRRGYDLTPYLPFVLQPGWMQAWDEHYSPPYFEASTPDLADRVRSDYRRTVSELTFTGFIDPFVKWNHARGLKAKFQAHGGAIDVIRGYGVVDIPETEDLVHKGDPYFMRLARSGADLYGRPIVSVESFVWPERPYDVTPDELRRRADRLFAGGANSIVAHGMDYRFHPEEWPGWHAFTPSGFSAGFSTMLTETNPIWPAVRPLASYISRMQAVLQAGTPIVPVAYFYGRTGYYIGIEDQGAGKQAGERAFLAAGFDFDRINPDAISRARVSGRELVSGGGHRYSVLVLPQLDAVQADTAEAIERFARAGLPVVFTDRAPSRSDGLADAPRQDARVRRAVQRTIGAGARIVPAAQIGAALDALKVPANLKFASSASDDLVFVQRRHQGRLATFVLNAGDMERDATLTLPGAHGIEKWNAVDGTKVGLATSESSAGLRIPLRLAAGESALLVSTKADVAERTPEARVAATAPLPQAGWSLSVVGHVSRQPFRATYADARLGTWASNPQLVRFAGTGTYSGSIVIDPTWKRSDGRVVLDLGEVHDAATVRVNGRVLPMAFTRPFRVDVTDAVRAGSNDVEVAIVTTPQNAILDPKSSALKKLQPAPTGWVGPARVELLAR